MRRANNTPTAAPRAPRRSRRRGRRAPPPVAAAAPVAAASAASPAAHSHFAAARYSDDDSAGSNDDGTAYFRDGGWDPFTGRAYAGGYGDSDYDSEDSAYFGDYDGYDSDGFLYDEDDFEARYVAAAQQLASSSRSARLSGNRREPQAAATTAAAAAPKPKPPPPVLCRFFVLGKCKYGSHCSYSHTLPAPAEDCEMTEEDNLTAAAALVDCPYFLRGNCKYGQYCRLRHSVPEAHGAAPQRGSAVGSVVAPTPATSSSNQHDADGGERDHTCGICFDDVVEAGKYFGLLSCDHCYCLDCLRSWRQSKDMEAEVTRSCPACRLPSNYIVPSLSFCTGDAKQKVVEAYKSHLSVRECKYFNGAIGSCPFGPHCFYAHRNSEGQDIKHLDRPRRSKQRHRPGHRGLPAGESLSSLLSNYGSLVRFLESLDWDEYGDAEFVMDTGGWD